MKRHIVSLGLIVAIAVAWFLWRHEAMSPPDRSHAAATAAHGGSTAGSSASSASGSAKTPPLVRQISREDRQRLVEQITAARAVREAHAAHAAGDGSAPALPEDDHTHDMDHLAPSVLDALNAAIPFLGACYEARGSGSGQVPPGKTAVALLTLTNDPDIGAVIDTDQILDEHQAPLAPELDACLRNTIQTLQLPPLDAGDRVKLQYSFKADDPPNK